MLHYRTLFDEDEDFSQVAVSCHGSQAVSLFRQHACIPQRWDQFLWKLARWASHVPQQPRRGHVLPSYLH